MRSDRDGVKSRHPVVEFRRSFSIAALLALALTASTLGNAAVAAAASQSPGAVGGVKLSLPRSIPPHPAFLTPTVCGYARPNDSAHCNATIIKAIDNARKTEPLGGFPKTFSLAAFGRLSPGEQIFAIADIERIARGLPPMTGLTPQLDAIALSGAVHQTDPSVNAPLKLNKGGGTATAWGSNWAGGTANALGADYYWMYDDGLNSPNSACTKSNESACWGHRKNILWNWSNPAYCAAGPINLLMGVAEVKVKVSVPPSIAEVFVNDCGPLPKNVLVTWAQVQALIFSNPA